MNTTPTGLTFYRFRQVTRSLGLAVLMIGGAFQMASNVHAASDGAQAPEQIECVTADAESLDETTRHDSDLDEVDGLVDDICAKGSV